MIVHSSIMQTALGKFAPALWFDIAPISAGVFGVPAGILTVVAVSLAFPDTKAPKQHII